MKEKDLERIVKKVSGRIRVFYLWECPLCKEMQEIRSDRVKTIKSCHPCHHGIRRQQSPGPNFDWCNKCKEWKLRTEFSYRKDGSKRNCRLCETTYRKETQHLRNKVNNKWRSKNRENILLSGSKSRAKSKGLPFNLTLEDIIIPDFCPVLGIKITVDKNKNTSPSIDRTIPELGYVKGNVEIISWRANWLKNNASLDEVKALYEYLNAKSMKQDG